MLPLERLNKTPFPISILTPDHLLERICVRPPYFALSDLQQEGATLIATASAELPQSSEIGPMQGAELSRHAAIAGLCVAALSQADSQRRYYLAQKASYLGYVTSAPYGAPVTLRAQLLSMDKRVAVSQVEASVDGQLLAEIEVTYTILTDNAFARLFRSRLQPDFGVKPQGVMGQLPKGRLSHQAERWSREIDQIPAAACAGHFENYPAMPVAILMGQLIDLAAMSLGEQPFHGVSAEVDAHDFCWAGEPARFEVEPVSDDGHQVLFDCNAYSGDRMVGHMQTRLNRH